MGTLHRNAMTFTPLIRTSIPVSLSSRLSFTSLLQRWKQCTRQCNIYFSANDLTTNSDSGNSCTAHCQICFEICRYSASRSPRNTFRRIARNWRFVRLKSIIRSKGRACYWRRKLVFIISIELNLIHNYIACFFFSFNKQEINVITIFLTFSIGSKSKKI